MFGSICIKPLLRGWGLLVVLTASGIAWAGDAELLNTLNRQFHAAYEAGKYQEAERLGRELLEVVQRSFANDQEKLGGALNNLANVLHDLGRYADAETLQKRALELRQKTFGAGDARVAESLNNLGALYAAQGKLREAEEHYRRSLSIREKKPGSREIADLQNNLAIVLAELGRYGEAEKYYSRALDVRKQLFGKNHLLVAQSLNNFGDLYSAKGELSAAEKNFRESLAIREHLLGQKHITVAQSLNNLGVVCMEQGRYAEAESLYRRALQIRRDTYRQSHVDIAATLNNLAILSGRLGRIAEEESLAKEALMMRQELLGGEHRDVFASLNNLAVFYKKQGRFDEAIPVYKRLLKYGEAQADSNPAILAIVLNNLASLNEIQGKISEAETHYRRSLDLRRKNLGNFHPDTVQSLKNLANLLKNSDRNDQAESLIDEAISNTAPTRTGPRDQFYLYFVRAQIRYALGKKSDAVKDLERALDEAERQRAISSDDDADRATMLDTFSEAFAAMIEWKAADGLIFDALRAADRARARSLLDQLQFAGVDVLAGLPADQSNRLRHRHKSSQDKLFSIAKQIEHARNSKYIPDTERSARLTQLEAELSATQDEAVEAYRAIRGISPALLQAERANGQVDDEALQNWLGDQQAVMLYYLVGARSSYVLVLNGRRDPQIFPLKLTKDNLGELACPLGPITNQNVHQLLQIGDRLLPQLVAGVKAESSFTNRLADLWNILVPAPVREELSNDKCQLLVVVPDGPLNWVPFEALIVERGEDPKYFLDVGPPVAYLPSVAVLQNLSARPRAASRQHSVLTVGDPKYPPRSATTETSSDSSNKPRARYIRTAGGLPSLPNTRNECAWIKEAFEKKQASVEQLLSGQATERNAVAQSQNRTITHFACHGIVDQLRGNLFGALALTPGPQNSTDSNDDGFLTLAEIYRLNLKGCELAILSACETNYGPQQRGEGSWTLSRGFLVAGSRRVMASNWLVDDQAAANLVSVFCQHITKDQTEAQSDYAEALHKAKLWVRKQDKWKHPYYWGTFVLIGPN